MISSFRQEMNVEHTKTGRWPSLQVVGVAIKAQDGTIYSLPPPNRHHNIIRLMTEAGRSKLDMREQGFILSDHTYATREKAKIVAIAAKQLLPRASKSKELFSECIW